LAPLSVISDVNILFVSAELPSFVARDLKILRERHSVVVRFIHHTNPVRFLGDIRALWQSDLLYIWFASIYALPLVVAAKLFGKRIVTVVGGYEAANEPEIEYGSARTPWRRTLVRWILLLSDQILAVSLSSEKEIRRNLAIAPGKTRLLYHGFEDTAAGGSSHRSPMVLNVGCASEGTWMRKGIYDLLLTAEQMPDVRFVHIGSLRIDISTKLGRLLPSNFTCTGRASSEQLGEYMSSAKVYLQLSRHEGFGCSVAEAMLCRCIPVVSNAAALPEVVGDCGIIVESRAMGDIVGAIGRALVMLDTEGERARQRILTHFPYERRRDDLLRIIEELSAR
jgi:glycosyltransferase involved in cell wall biosynthesis